MDWKAKSLRPGVALAISAAGLMSASAAGQVTLDCSANNATSLVPAPGERVTISIALEGEDTDFYTSVVFRVVFTAPGMAIEEYLFAGPFDTGTWLDGSLPGVELLPATIDEAMLEGPMWPIETSDMLFDNFLLSGFATPGSLLEFEISIPKDFPTGDSVYVVAVPEEIADGFDVLDAEAGTVLELFVDVARPEDLNRDGVVDGADLGLLFVGWGEATDPPAGQRTADLNDDGFVDGGDIGAILAAWG